MKRNRTMWLLIGLIILNPAILMAGGAQEDKDPQTGKVVINFAGNPSQAEANELIMDQFNSSQDKITVKFIGLPADQGSQHDAYVTALSAGGSEYDVITSNVIWPAEFSQADFVLPLDRFIERDDINLTDYVQGYIDAYTFQGRLWGMPLYGNAGLLYYRTDIIDTPPKTWEELVKMSKEHMGENGTEKGFVFQAAQYEGLVCNAAEYISSHGGTIIDADGNIAIASEDAIEGLTTMVNIAQSDIVPSDIVNFKENETLIYFLAGKAVFARNWPYMWGLSQDESESQVVGKVGTAPLPAGDSGSAAALGGWGVMINKNTKNPEAAWEFVKFLTGPEGQKINAVVGSQLPTYLPLYKDQEVLEANPTFARFEEGIKAAVSRPVTPIYTEISDILQIEMSKALMGVTSVEESVRAAEDRMTEAMKAAQ